MPKNFDQDVPTSEPEAEPVQTKFDEISIFWGPNQPLTGFDNYNEPADWRENENLNIPIVVRMHNISPGEYDTDAYSDDAPEICQWRVQEGLGGTSIGGTTPGGNWYITIRDYDGEVPGSIFINCDTGLPADAEHEDEVNETWPVGTVYFVSCTDPCPEII